MKSQVKLTKAVAKKVLETVDAGLCSGLGQQEPGQMCVEAAVCYALGLPHGDNPPCVGSAVRAFKINLNDARWSSNEARAEGMRGLAIAQLGSDEIDQNEFRKLVFVGIVSQVLPPVFRTVAALQPEYKEAFELAAKVCSAATVYESAKIAARKARDVTHKFRSAYAADDADDADAYAAYAADAYAYAAADAAADDADAYAAAAYAADAYAAAAYAADDADAKRAKARDGVLRQAADIGLQALKKLKSPGCKWLDLLS